MKTKYRQVELTWTPMNQISGVPDIVKKVVWIPEMFAVMGNWIRLDGDFRGSVPWQITDLYISISDEAIDTNKLIREHRKNTGDSTLRRKA
ncbi:MAG: hypothetical protein WC554_08495 [Clostridia bacterium]|jgi:hypothetical protein